MTRRSLVPTLALLVLGGCIVAADPPPPPRVVYYRQVRPRPRPRPQVQVQVAQPGLAVGRPPADPTQADDDSPPDPPPPPSPPPRNAPPPPPPEGNLFPDRGPELSHEEMGAIPSYDSATAYSFGAIVKEGYSSSPHYMAFRCGQKSCPQSPMGNGWVAAGWYGYN